MVEPPTTPAAHKPTLAVTSCSGTHGCIEASSGSLACSAGRRVATNRILSAENVKQWCYGAGRAAGQQGPAWQRSSMLWMEGCGPCLAAAAKRGKVRALQCTVCMGSEGARRRLPNK